MTPNVPPGARSHADPVSGVWVRQLTDFRCHSHHLYFTNNGLWDGGRRLVIGSHRDGAENFYSVDLDGGEITRLTDFGRDEKLAMLRGFVSPVREELCFFRGRTLLAVDLRSRRRRELYDVPEGFVPGNLSPTADGNTVCFLEREDLSGQTTIDLGHQYIGFRELFEANPLCRVTAVPVDGGPASVVHEDRCWISHVNTSPTRPDRLTFCHEGPWELVAQRMWLLDIASGEASALRPQKPTEAVGHEYWFADGRRVGYHGRESGRSFFGYVDTDNARWREWDFACGSIHFHSMDESLIVGDGNHQHRCLLLWALRAEGYAGPKVLAVHRGSWHVQIVHVHPRMFERGGRTHVVYTADPKGYGNVFLAEVPSFDGLPDLEETDQ